MKFVFYDQNCLTSIRWGGSHTDYPGDGRKEGCYEQYCGQH
ncbi:MAG: hypothetical protein ACTSPG_02965 [Candidatus Hodarchaeales archaeon]